MCFYLGCTSLYILSSLYFLPYSTFYILPLTLCLSLYYLFSSIFFLFLSCSFLIFYSDIFVLYHFSRRILRLPHSLCSSLFSLFPRHLFNVIGIITFFLALFYVLIFYIITTYTIYCDKIL